MTTNDSTWKPGHPLLPLVAPVTPLEPVSAAGATTAEPSWARPAFWVLIFATALLYLWGLGQSGWANDFYSAAAQAGSESWKALFYGSSDAANSITVDKPPVSLWFMALSVRIFGLSSWSILIPQALMGVASVALLHATVRRWFGAPAALIAGAVMAVTPVAVLMFRFNNPDALLVLLLTAGAYATVRALERGNMWWLVAAGSAVGFAFLTKMLQALLVVPAFAIVYLVAAPLSLSRRLAHVAAAGAAVVASAGWWVAIVELVPASARPYIGGSQNNSVLELIFGYNGFGRLTGNQVGSVGGRAAPGGGGMWGETSWHRMFDADWGGQIAWLIPAALGAIVVGLVLTRRAPRTDRTRAAIILWGLWLIVTMFTFSYGQGIIHNYYAVALAPAIGALVGIGATLLWTRHDDIRARIVLALAVLSSAFLAFVLLGRSADWHPELRSLVIAAGLVASVLLVVAPNVHRRVPALAITASVVALFSAPMAYSLQTASTDHSGALPSAGPTAGQGVGPGRADGQRRAMPGGPGALPGGQTPGAPANAGGPGPQAARGGAGGLLRGSQSSAEVVTLLRADASNYTWVAAAVGANSAAGYQLASGEPVMPLGGFNGSDPSPTLAQFQEYVRNGEIHWFVGGGRFGSQMGGSRASSEITSWVEQNFDGETVDGITLYDLSRTSDTLG